MNISIDAEKSFNKIPHPFVIKVTERLGIQGGYLKKIKDVYDKPIANIIRNAENLKAFPLGSGRWKGGPLSPIQWSD